MFFIQSAAVFAAISWKRIVFSFWYFKLTIRYDKIRYDTRCYFNVRSKANLIYRTEPTTKKCKKRKTKSRKQVCLEVTVDSPGNPWSQCRRRNATVETGGWEWCDWIWELWQYHVQESSVSVGAGWSETWAGYDKQSCSIRAWSEQWKWRRWKLFWYPCMDGCSEADGCGYLETDEIWSEKVFIKYEAEVSSRVSCKWGVVDFGKLFTETNEQKFSLGGVQC